MRYIFEEYGTRIDLTRLKYLIAATLMLHPLFQDSEVEHFVPREFNNQILFCKPYVSFHTKTGNEVLEYVTSLSETLS